MRNGWETGPPPDGIMRLITKSGPLVSGLRAQMATIESPTARALPARFYRDPEVVELERRRIFERSWQLVAHVSSLSQPGTYMTAAAGSQPVLVLRDDEGVLRAFRNVCRHRGSRLLSG